jgi:hypothetical protein
MTPGWDDGHDKVGNKEGGGDIPYCAMHTAHCAHEVQADNDPDDGPNYEGNTRPLGRQAREEHPRPVQVKPEPQLIVPV